MTKEQVLVTGGLGYIGSHTIVSLIEKNYQPIVVDNLSNSDKKVVKRLEQLTGEPLIYELCDVRDTDKLEQIIKKYKPAWVIHFAALKSVSESVEQPLEYYDNNVGGLISLLKAMRRQKVCKLVFSSSATVYGRITEPAVESMPLGRPTTPYGATKEQCERILEDMAAAYPDWSVAVLRYFNPIGAHPSGLIGENPKDIPNNLMPYITKVAVGELDHLSVFGDDYPTPDGTCIRDYIHVVDLGLGHVAVLEKAASGLVVYNLGTGKGSSVKELIDVFQKTSGAKLAYKIEGRREGDLPEVIADPSKAARELAWRTQYDLKDMCRDAWNWQTKNPQGY
jgi:UDP-glucose 4-epimerase